MKKLNLIAIPDLDNGASLRWSWFRICIYLLIGLLYFLLMTTYSPLGLTWRDFHLENIQNGLANIFENPVLIQHGYTSWGNPDDVRSNLNVIDQTVYLVPAITYIPHLFLKLLFLDYDPSLFGPLVDYFLILSTAVIVSEFAILIFDSSSYILASFLSITCFAIFLFSPWSYRMMLAPWYEVPFVASYISSIYCFSKKKLLTGFLFQALAIFINWEWGFLISTFFVLVYVIQKFHLTRDSVISYVPFLLKTTKQKLLYFASLLLPIAVTLNQSIFAKFSGVQHGGNGALYRIGIDSADNIHHGGLLGSLQFLGGNRLSLCLPSASGLSGLSTDLNIKIAFANCIFSIFGMVIISILAIIGFILLMQSKNKFALYLAPLAWSFLMYVFIFQQSFAAHLQGHSFVFNVFYSIGLTWFIQYIFCHCISKRTDILILFCSPLVIGILLNSVRVSYLTGING